MKKAYIWLFLVLLATYIILAFGLPTDPKVLSRYELSQTEARLANLTVVLPFTLIYLTALYGFVRFSRYAESVQDSKEGPNLVRIARGLMILALSLPLGSVVSTLNTFIRHRYPHWATETIVIRNYLALIIAFIAIYFIAQGIEGLYHTLNKRTVSELPFYGFLLPVSLASIFTWLITMQHNSSGTVQTYDLPDGVIIATLVIPYTFIWCVGIRAAIQLYDYQASVKGTVYRVALQNISKGIAVLIFTSVFLQFLTTLSEQLNRLSLTPILVIVYILIILYAIGYGFVARGAKKLSQIEEV
ncbi:MAG: hypothetical protein M3Q14_01080 [bacterium]|nr:hypothetical protein [bacterium]